VFKDLIDSGTIPTSKLTVIHRQEKGSVIPEFAAGIKEKRVLPLWNGRDLSFQETKDAEETAQAVVNLVKRDMEEGRSIREIQVLTGMHKGPAGTMALNKALQDVVLPPETRGAALVFGNTAFHIGDKVMQFQNDYEKGVMNGETGLVSHVDLSGKNVVIEFDGGKFVTYKQPELDTVGLAYASSGHKSQGGEYSRVYGVIDKSQYIILNNPWVYTVVTRAKDVFVGVGQQQTLFMAVKNERAIPRETLLLGFLTGRAKPLQISEIGKDSMTYAERE
jgi:exodeoxyribonuclease V alpha subunit